jgi:hypothetical protein
MENLTLEERGSLTRRVISLLTDWGMRAPDMHRILDLPAAVGMPAMGIAGEAEPLPDEPQVMRRVGYLVRIEDALQTYFPRNTEMRTLWVRKGNRQFGKRSPLAVMLEEGERGLVLVLAHLDCTFAWDITGSKTDYDQATPPA